MARFAIAGKYTSIYYTNIIFDIKNLENCISINSNNFDIQPISITLHNSTYVSHHRILKIIVKETCQKVHKNPKTNICNGNVIKNI